MPIDPNALAKSIGELETFDSAHGLEEGLDRVLTGAKILFDADAVGLMLLAEDGGELREASASDKRSQRAEVAQERAGEGPCQQAFADWKVVTVADFRTDPALERIAEAMAAAGIRAALSVPVELQDSPVGTLDLYSTTPRDWGDDEITAAYAYARVVGSLLEASLAAHLQGRLAAQLQVALDTRVLIEQAKGVLMAADGIDARAAWERLRGQARSTNRRAIDVAREVIQTVPPNAQLHRGA